MRFHIGIWSVTLHHNAQSPTAGPFHTQQIERKLTRVKERAIDKGKWQGHAGPHHPHLEENEFKEYREEVGGLL
jgi:hypothetical protein